MRHSLPVVAILAMTGLGASAEFQKFNPTETVVEGETAFWGEVIHIPGEASFQINGETIAEAEHEPPRTDFPSGIEHELEEGKHEWSISLEAYSTLKTQEKLISEEK